MNAPLPGAWPRAAWGLRALRDGFSSPAGAADKALGVVGPPQGGDDLSGDEVPAAVTAGPVELLVVMGADVLLVLKEEARLGQVAATHCGGRTRTRQGAAGRSMAGISEPTAAASQRVSLPSRHTGAFPQHHKMSVSGCGGVQDGPAQLARAGHSQRKPQSREGNPCSPHPPRTNSPGGSVASPPGPTAPGWGSAPPFDTHRVLGSQEQDGKELGMP